MIDWVKGKEDQAIDYSVYAHPGALDAPTRDTLCYLDEPVEVSDDDEEVNPAFARDRGLVPLFRDELLFEASTSS